MIAHFSKNWVRSIQAYTKWNLCQTDLFYKFDIDLSRHNQLKHRPTKQFHWWNMW